jgi:serine/threonine-protein kinase
VHAAPRISKVDSPVNPLSDGAQSQLALNEASPFDLDKYAPGDRISDKYRLQTPLGYGAMGVLWRAQNDDLDAPVAVKLLRRDVRWAWSSDWLRREARVMASLRHPAIVQVFDCGVTARRDPFIAMELLQGEGLRDVLERENVLTAVEAVRLLLPILEGLECVHARGIVHRDLKPDNIFLARDDRGRIQPKLLDFGIAKMQGAASQVTTGGMLLGSPGYMSPEQAEGAVDVDARVDVWGAAVVLYEMISGHLPWDANNTPALLRAIVDDPAPSILGVGGIDARLWSILEKGLAKRRTGRWQSCRDFGRELAAWLASSAIIDDVTGKSLSNIWLAAAGVARSSTNLVWQQEHERLRSAHRGISLATPRAASLALLFAACAGGVIVFAVRSGASNPASAEVVPTTALVEPMPVAAPPASAAASREATPQANCVHDVGGAAELVAPNVRVRRKSPSPARAAPLVTAAPNAALPSIRAAPAAPRSARTMDFGF